MGPAPTAATFAWIALKVALGAAFKLLPIAFLVLLPVPSPQRRPALPPLPAGLALLAAKDGARAVRSATTRAPGSKRPARGSRT